ncbi:LysR family transcriptional regulator [Cytobacillus sp. FJAT-54145]|uniref:LysR family transcriptional regulator n=1 Tax=Cytobacillus spartinae TaxID=3299023 RepID=A0ABW6KCW4_9BACI
MTLLQFEVFMVVAEVKSFTQASKQLGYTQSAVSQMISSLEKELNVKLLNRSRSGITLTTIGERMLKHVKEIYRIKETMYQEASSYNGLNVGALKIGVTPSVFTKLIPKIIPTFKKVYPDIDLVIFEGTYEDVTSLLENDDIDLGFTILERENNMGQIPVLEDQLMILLKDTLPLATEENLTVSQIHESCFILPKGDCDQLIKEVFKKSELTPTIRYEIQDTSTIMAMVREGIALTILPELAIPNEIAGVKTIPLKPIERRKIGFVVKDLQTISPGAAEFILHAKTMIASES